MPSLDPCADTNAEGGEATSLEFARQRALLLRILDGIDELHRRLAGQIKSHYTVDEVASLTGRVPYTVRAWIRNGRISAIRVAGTGPRGRLLIPHGELRKLLAAGLAAEVPAAALV